MHLDGQKHIVNTVSRHVIQPIKQCTELQDLAIFAVDQWYIATGNVCCTARFEVAEEVNAHL